MTDPLAEALRALRREYLGDSVARVAELRRLLAPTEQGDRAALDGLRRALHKLAGSGGSYGFELVSQASRAGEQIARRLIETGAAATPQDLAGLRDAVDRVDAAFRDARTAPERPGSS